MGFCRFKLCVVVLVFSSSCALLTPCAAATVAAMDDDLTGAAVVTIDVHEAKHLVDSGGYVFLDVR